MVNVTNRADVAVRLVTFELFLGHFSLPWTPEGPAMNGISGV